LDWCISSKQSRVTTGGITVNNGTGIGMIMSEHGGDGGDDGGGIAYPDLPRTVETASNLNWSLISFCRCGCAFAGCGGKS
jgi:hypothetical protein